MFIRPEPGSVITWNGQTLFFHSSPPGIYQYEHVETGEIFKWTQKEFAEIAGSGEFTNVTRFSMCIGPSVMHFSSRRPAAWAPEDA